MYSDWDLVSIEKHELNYMLSEWFECSESIVNREKLKGVIKDFKKNSSYLPHHHKDLKRYINDYDIEIC